MRALLSAAAAAILFTAVAVPQVALAAAHPRVQPLDCQSIAAKVGPGKVWQAAFWAKMGGDDFDPYESIMVAPCFSSQASCVDWLYWEQTDWPDQDYVGRCKAGMPY